MSDEKVLAEADNPKLGLLTVSVVVVLAIIVVICIGVDQFYRFAVQDEISAKILQPQSPQLRDLRAKEKHDLTTYQYVNKEEGIVRIPVDRAVSLVLADWEGRPSGTTPIPGSAPAGETTSPTQNGAAPANPK